MGDNSWYWTSPFVWTYTLLPIPKEFFPLELNEKETQFFSELFLKSNKVTPKKSMYDGIKDNNKLLEILEDGTVYTYCD